MFGAGRRVPSSRRVPPHACGRARTRVFVTFTGVATLTEASITSQVCCHHLPPPVRLLPLLPLYSLRLRWQWEVHTYLRDGHGNDRNSTAQQ